jgi:glycosyltransferase involved in cell wall biosynthesis
MYPAFEGDYRGVFIHQMVKDLESRGVIVQKAVKTISSPVGYAHFYYDSLILARNDTLDLMQAEYIPHSSIIPAIVGLRDVPLVLKFHGDDARIFPFKNRFNMSLTRYMLRKADHVITASEEIRQILLRIGAPADQVTSIHSGVDTSVFTKKDRDECRSLLGLPHAKTIFLFVGRLHPWKGVPDLIEAARRNPDYLFIFIGPGTPPTHPVNCIFPGTKPHGEICTWMNAADCFVLPTYTEAVPTSIMEAFACGIPAIATNVGGCPEIVTHSVTGLLVPVSDISALQKAVEWMGTHPEERELMGENARVCVKQQFEHRMLTDQLISIHTSVLENTPVSPQTK